jgi:Replication-relaxation
VTMPLRPSLARSTAWSSAAAGTDDGEESAGGTGRPVLRSLAYQMLPVLRASNGPVYIHPDDRRYGVLAVGGQGSGKTALLLRLYLSDIRDPDAAPIVVDPKSELARLCLEMTPPDCGKRVWFLDLGRPMFGMSPLRRDPARTLPEQASAIADNIVQAISDTAEGQVFQSSRRYLYHAVIGALALANKHGGLAMFEDVFALLLPAREDLREAAVNACQEFADLDHTTEFFRVTLPDELDANRSNTYQRLDPPRNKIETILASPSLRRFYNHPTDISLAEIVRARDILIVDANMGALGENNAQVVMHLFFQQLHALMQQQVHLPPRERPRVPTIWDEGGYVASMNTIKQAATHREAGLEIAMGIQYVSQLGAKAESPAVTEAIRKGVTNLLQSRCLFRLSDPEDAETQTRVAMSVYQSMIRADLDSRELMGTTPEESIYLPVWYCLASLIAAGARAARFYGQTYPFQKLRGGPWAAHHLSQLEQAVGPYPEQLPKTYKRTGSSTGSEENQPNAPPAATQRDATAQRSATAASPTGRAPKRLAAQSLGSAPSASGERDRNTTAPSVPQPPVEAGQPASRKRVTPLIREAGEVPEVQRSPLRTIIGATQPQQAQREKQEAPEGLRELAAYVDPLLGIKRAEQREPAERLPRLYAEDYAILALLDRVGLILPGMLRRAVMPGAAERTMRGRMNDKLLRHGLVARWPIVLRDPPRGAVPCLYSLTRYGLQVAQARQPAAIPPSRSFREQEAEKDGHIRHDLHTLSWVIELRRLLGPQATEKWRTPRWPAGTCPVPQIGNGRNRRPITLKDVKHAKHIGIFDLDSTDVARLAPDATCEIRLAEDGLTFDLILEMDLTDRTAYNIPKFKRYDAFLTAWWSEMRRYQQLGTRPGVIFVCRTPEMAMAYARAADETLHGSIGVTGSPAHERYYPAREHIFFAAEPDIYHGDLSVLALHPLPPEIREALDGSRSPVLSRVLLFPERILRAGRRIRQA